VIGAKVWPLPIPPAPSPPFSKLVVVPLIKAALALYFNEIAVLICILPKHRSQQQSFDTFLVS
jgi:hypothetical protein